MKRILLMATMVLAGCAPLQYGTVGTFKEALVYPHYFLKTQAIVDPLTVASVATLDIIPYIEVTPGVFSPISAVTGNATTFGASDMLKLTQASPSIDSGRPFVIRKLKPSKNYRLFAKAYNASNALISLDASSTADICVTNDDAPAMATLPVYLGKVPFSATMSVAVTAFGRFDYLKGTLFLTPGSTQVAIAQTTSSNPNFTFTNLQGNTNYNLVVDAYKLGSVVASKTLTLSIANDNTPAAQSLSISVPSIVSTLAGASQGYLDGQGTAAQFNCPWSLKVDTAGNAYVADYVNNLIRKISSSGAVTTFAGGGGAKNAGYSDGAGTAALFDWPDGIAIDAAGTLYVSEEHNNRIRKITSAGVVTTLAGSTQGYADGASAKFSCPRGMALDAAGNVYVADRNNNLIRKITTGGVVSTLAGGGGGTATGYSEGAGTAALFNCPEDVAVDAAGNVYVADYFNHCIRKVTSGGVVSTFAGGVSGNADGMGTAAKFSTPSGITIDSAGTLYVTDYNSNLVRRITNNGVVTTLAGSSVGTTDGTGTSAKFYGLIGVAVDNAGVLYVADLNNHRIRVLK